MNSTLQCGKNLRRRLNELMSRVNSGSPQQARTPTAEALVSLVPVMPFHLLTLLRARACPRLFRALSEKQADTSTVPPGVPPGKVKEGKPGYLAVTQQAL